jgi:phage terminase small subunit
MSEKKLSLKQKKFTTEFIKSGNATLAAKKAGYSRKTARQMGSENLAKPVIQQAVASAAEKLGINPEYVLGNFKEIAEFNKQKRIKAKQIGSETFHEEEMIDVHASIRANEMLGKHLSLFTEKSEIDVKVEDLTESRSKLELAKQIALALKNPESL